MSLFFRTKRGRTPEGARGNCRPDAHRTVGFGDILQPYMIRKGIPNRRTKNSATMYESCQNENATFLANREIVSPDN